MSQSIRSHQYAIVEDGYKLIYDRDWDLWMLYDLAADPGETRDLSAARPEIVARLRPRLLAWHAAQLDYYSDRERQRREYPPVMAD